MSWESEIAQTLSKTPGGTKTVNAFTATDIVTRAKLREEIRRKVRRIDMHFGERQY
jgi:hypothetical protein